MVELRVVRQAVFPARGQEERGGAVKATCILCDLTCNFPAAP
jgi:hypothetical protein